MKTTPQEIADYDLALQVAPYGDDDDVKRRTIDVIEKGHAILQIHRLAPTDEGHVQALLAAFDIPRGASVLDCGCGVGAVAIHMYEERPDLKITLLNISQAQLDLCPHWFPAIAANFHDIPTADETFDAVMYGYSIGHGLIDNVLREAARVTKRGGVVFIYDLAADDSRALIASMGYKAHPFSRVLEAAASAGLSVDVARIVDESDVTGFIGLIGQAAYDHIFAGVKPVLYRFVKPHA